MKEYYQKYLKYKDKYIKLKQLRGGALEPIESEIVIVCHCSKEYQTHPKLYYINIKDNSCKKEIGEGVRHVDPICEDNKWDKIDDNSIMYIWGVHCPIYLSFDTNTVSEGDSRDSPYRAVSTSGYGSYVIDDILKNAYKKLRVNGKVLFPVYGIKNPKDRLFEYFEQKICDKSEGFDGFGVSKEPIDKFPYIIANNNKHDLENKENKENKEYYVFTKYI
jgi:hypothetical protein